VAVCAADRELRLVGGNAAALQLLGLEAHTESGASLATALPVTAPSLRLLEAHRKALAGERTRVEIRREGRVHDLILDPIRDERDQITGALAIATDVTDRSAREEALERQLEGERREHAAADLAVRARDRFLGVASHELRTPLSSLSLVLQAMVKRARDDEALRPLGRQLELAERQLVRLRALVNQMLDGSRLSTGRPLELLPEPMDLGGLTRQVVERFEPELQRAGVMVTIRVHEGVVGSWDRSRLDQAIGNLVDNALKYGSGNPIEVSVERTADGRARLRVRDGGIGIAPEDVPLLFQAFERLHGDRQYRGLGLGLFIVSEIVRAHGGTIAVDSAPGRGTAFTMELPIS
jgi:PAS domain S-box-containing protein